VLQLASHVLVKIHRGVGEVPRTTVRVGFGIGRLGQRAMYVPTVARACRAIRRRPHERVVEAHSRAKLDQARCLGR